MSKLRKHFTREERLEIVRESFEHDAKVIDVAERFGISANTLSKWRRELREELGLKHQGQGIKILSEEERRIAQLERQLREAQLERDILKKAIGIFSKGGGKSTSL